MDLNLKIFLTFLLLVGIISIYKTIKKKKLSMKFGMFWTIIFCFMLVLIIFPNIIEKLSQLLGFKEAPNMLFLIAIFILFYIIFVIYTTITKLSEANKSLIQELSILKKEIENRELE